MSDPAWEKACKDDPFLRLHRYGDIPRVLALGGQLAPLSIRDQMFRAAVAVDRAVHYGLISDAEDLSGRLIVVGGSAAGVTAAIRASRSYNVPVHLVEEKDYRFFRQYNCGTRIVSPTQYDWPAPHANQHIYPWRGTPDVELAWPEPRRTAKDLADRWNTAFLVDRSPRLTTAFATKYSSVTTSGKKATVETVPPLADPSASLVILATGLGREKCDQNHHHGYGFWDEDPYLEPYLGCAQPPDVVISGSGDGALQDFIRIATGYNVALDLYEKLPWHDSAVRSNLEAVIAAAQAQYDRAMIWSTKGSLDCEILEPLHRTFQEQIRSLPVAFWSDLRAALGSSIRVGGDVASLRLIQSCTHFASCYALNRFLVLLLAEYLRRFQHEAILENARLKSVSSATCLGGSATACLGKRHRVEVQHDHKCYIPGSPAERFEEIGDADVLVIRHGIEPPEETSKQGSIRQTVPLYMPWKKPRP